MGENTNRSEPFFDEDVDLVKLQFTEFLDSANGPDDAEAGGKSVKEG